MKTVENFATASLARRLQNQLWAAVQFSRDGQGSVHMTMFDPFESDRSREQLSCICGRHRSQAEHDYAARLTLECAPVDRAARKDERFAGVVAARAMRTAFGRAPRR
jgi:hypothetical protein